MTINRHNYEEYFLLYVDNELSLHQRMEVELFAEQNPDLQAELKMLQEATLADTDAIAFPDKATLLKHEDVAISLHNHEEQFLLYLDNELNRKGREEVEKFVLQQPQLQESFSLLKQAVLQPEVIFHPDKASLYRYEEERRVVPFRWVRYAAAAAVLGIAVTLWQMNKIDQTTTPPQFATANSKITTPKTVQHSGSQTGEGPKTNNNTGIAEVTQTKHTSGTTDVATFPTRNGVENNNANNSPATLPEQTKAPYTLASIETNVSEPEKNNLVVTNMDAKPLQTVQVSEPVLKELDTNDEPNGIYIGSLELNRNKVKGFLRKAGNLFSAKAKGPEEDKIQVANFEIKKNQQK